MVMLGAGATRFDVVPEGLMRTFHKQGDLGQAHGSRASLLFHSVEVKANFDR